MPKELSPYVPTLFALLAMNLLVASAFEALHTEHLTADGLWNTRTALWAGLLLFDNLVAVGWYAHLTRRQVVVSAKQFKLASKLHRLSSKQYSLLQDQHRHAQTLRSEANKPFGVIDRKRVPEAERTPGEHVRYVIRNIGTGLAVNLYYVTGSRENHQVRAIGSLEGGGERTLSEHLEQPLRDHRPGDRHEVVVVAEGLRTRTQRWTATANVQLSSGEVVHQVIWLRLQAHGDTLEVCLMKHWDHIQENMHKLGASL